VVDTQVHFREPGLEHKEDIESGSRAALFGGVTTYFEMPNTSPATVSRGALLDKLGRATGRSWANFAFFIGATAENADQVGELELLPGTPGIKIFMGSSTGSLLVPDDPTLTRVLTNTKKRCPIHAEDHYCLQAHKDDFGETPSVHFHPMLRATECARSATERIFRIAAETGGRPHVLHISTADELSLIAEAKSSMDVTAEVTPQHLWFSAPDCYDRLGSLAQMNPPIRPAEHRDAIRKAVSEGGIFDVVGSDHAPHTREEKALGYPSSPSGMPGVQTLLSAMITMALRDGLISLERLIALACENPCALYGLRNKGRLEVGYDADIIAIDLKADRVFERQHIQSKCGWSPFEGERLRGWPIHVWVGGEHSLRDETVVGKPAGTVVEFK
jgi:dihydroorotase